MRCKGDKAYKIMWRYIISSKSAPYSYPINQSVNDSRFSSEKRSIAPDSELRISQSITHHHKVYLNLIFQLSFEGVSRGFSRMFKGCFMEVSMLFPKCLKAVSRQFSRCFKVVSCCMALIAATRAEGGLVSSNTNLFCSVSIRFTQ